MSGIGVGIRESNGAVLASFSQKIPPAYKAEEEQKAGVGVIIRDEHGRVIASMADRISLPFSVDVVEAFAAKEALKFAQECGLSAIVLEGDSKCTIDSLLCEDVSLVDIGHLIDEAKMSGIGVGIRESNGAVLASFSQKIPPAYKAEEEQKAGVGVIIRDEHGRVIASMADRISLPFSVDVVEAFAAKEALKFAQERGLSAIVLEGDSKCTIDSLLCEDVSLVDIGHLIDEAKMSGIGVGIRESNGAILASFSQKIPPAYKAEEIEALAALNALSFAFELGFCSTILKGDSVGLTQALKS
nr:hypothetical protein CFP56_77733 [Quercus suber]